MLSQVTEYHLTHRAPLRWFHRATLCQQVLDRATLNESTSSRGWPRWVTSLRQHRNPKLNPGLQDRIAHNVYVLSSKKFTVVPENEHLIPTWPALHGLWTSLRIFISLCCFCESSKVVKKVKPCSCPCCQFEPVTVGWLSFGFLSQKKSLGGFQWAAADKTDFF